jgi:hypothetical protein
MSSTPLIYRASTAALALLGSWGLALAGAISPAFLPALALLGLGYWRYLRGMSPAPKWTVDVASVLIAGLFLADALVLSADLLVAVAHLTLLFQALKAFDLREPWDNLQVFFMTLLQLVITSEFTRTLLFGALFVLILLGQVSALVMAHFIKEGTVRGKALRPGAVVAWVSALVLALSVLGFVAVPRVKAGFLGKGRQKSIQTVGFTETVRLGSFGEVKEDPTVVMRLKSPAPPPLYLRGSILDAFNGSSWENTFKGKELRLRGTQGRFLLPGPQGQGTLMPQEFLLEPLDAKVLFGLAGLRMVKINARELLLGPEGSLYLPRRPQRRILYTAFSAPSAGPPVKEVWKYLQLPPEGMERIRALAQRLAAQAEEDLQKARVLEAYLRQNFTYSLDVPPPPPGVSPIEDFLFGSRRGFCEHYATAMVLMLRSLFIPARMVTGFLATQRNPHGDYYIVRQRDAHTWVEALIGGRWMRFDPTPAVRLSPPSALSLYLDSLRLRWFRYVVSFSRSDQMRLLRGIWSPLRALPRLPEPQLPWQWALPALAVPALWAVRKLLRRPRGTGHRLESRLYERLRRRLRKQGLRDSPSLSPQELAQWACRRGLDIREFISVYERVRFGREHELRGRLKELYASLSLQPKAPTRGTNTQ